jgi:hypothetical protein
MSLKLEKIQEKIDQAKRQEALALTDLEPKAATLREAEAKLRQAQEEEAELTRRRQVAQQVYDDALAAATRAHGLHQQKIAERLRWEKAFEAALEE